MLYPKNQAPFDPQEFKNPGKEYRATPFWAFNSELNLPELTWQIEQLKKMGYGGVHMHVRTGMATPYLSDEYMALIKGCVDKAKKEDMLAWLYDEDRWPSGAAGGIVTKNPAYRQRYLKFSRSDKEPGELLAAYDVELNPDGSLKAYRRVKAGETPRGFMLYAIHQIAEDDPWYNNQAYLNTLDPQSVKQFLAVTHERYWESVGEEFGKTIPAIFTDEPQFARKGTLDYADSPMDVTLPWTPDFARTFKEKYAMDILDCLPELLWDLPGGAASQARYAYHDHIAQRFAQAFADQLGRWCDEHGIMLTGHMMEEPTLLSQTAALGDAMRSYRAFALPGIDMLCDRREYTTAKQAQSASRQYAREGVLSELYGVTNWDFDFRGHKLQGDWQAALGVTVRVPHLSWVSMNGEAKRDYPATFNYQSPWYEEYPLIENHFARLNTALTRGKALCHVAVIHPVESYWLSWGAKQNTQSIREQMDNQFKTLTEWLLRGLIDFDFICESLLPDQQAMDASFEGGFPVGAMRYQTIVVPPVRTLRRTTVERLARYAACGGRVIFLGKAPELMDARASEAPQRLFDACEHAAFDRVALLDALQGEREIEIRDESGAATQNLLYQMRTEGDERYLFIAQADSPENIDVPCRHTLRIRLRGAWSLERLDTLTGEISGFASEREGEWTLCRTDFYEEDSLLLRLRPVAPDARDARGTGEALEEQGERGAARFYLRPVPVTLHEPNVLLLDIAEYALDDAPWQACEEILRLDNAVRGQLGYPLRSNSVAQPWVESDKTPPHTLRLRYRFTSEAEIAGVSLALENARRSRVTLNGADAGDVEGWYVDKCIGVRPLPPVRAGENVLEVAVPYGKTVDVEAMYLLGDFGVNVKGCQASLTAPVRELAFGDITRQGLPFYGGNLTYHVQDSFEKGEYEITISKYRAHLIKVAVDGKEVGSVVFAPYRLRFSIAEAGLHRIDITLFGSRINTMGQLHNANEKTIWWGPDSWRTLDEKWAYEYQLWPQGILKSVEIAQVRR